jgi:F0F1-type ATP synthase assembly protein I
MEQSQVPKLSKKLAQMLNGGEAVKMVAFCTLIRISAMTVKPDVSMLPLTYSLSLYA